MPRASLSYTDAIETQLGIQEGFIEVVNGRTLIHQYPPNKETGVQGGPMACVQLDLMLLNEQGERQSDQDAPQKIELGLGGVNKQTGEFKFRPGMAAGPDDTDPQDMGSEVGAEGNSIYIDNENSKLNRKCKWASFIHSLEEKGFKPEISGRGYIPDFIGLKIHVITKVTKKEETGDDNDRKQLLVDKVLQFPWDVKKAAGTKAAAKPNPMAKPAAAVAAAAKPASAPASNGTSGTDAESIALAQLERFVLANIGKDPAERRKLQTSVQGGMMSSKPPVAILLHKPVLDLIKSDDWLTAQMTNEASTIYGKWMVDFDSQVVNFAPGE